MASRTKVRITECPYCKQSTMTIDDKHGTYVCTSCGYVSPVPVFDQTSEYRNFAVEHGVKDKNRSSYSGDGVVSNLGTSIAKTGSKENKELFNLTQRVTTDQKVVDLRKTFRRIQELAGRLGLNKRIARDAMEFYREGKEKKLITNQKKGAIDAVCISFACKKNGESMRREDILQKCDDITIREFTNTEKSLDSISPGTISPAETAYRYAERLKFKPYICEAIKAVGKQVEEYDMFQGKQPDSISGAYIMFINALLPDDLKVANNLICTVCNTAESTIMNYTRDIQGIADSMLQGIPAFQKMLEKIQKTKKH